MRFGLRTGASAFRTGVLTAIAYGFCAAASQAAVFDISVAFTGGQLGNVSFDVRLDADFSNGDIAPTTDGLTINALSIVPEGGFAYRYNALFDSVHFFGLSHDSVLLWEETDFFVVITSFLTAPTVSAIADSSALMPDAAGNPRVTALSVTPVSAVPLPTSGLLLLGAFGGVAALRRRKVRAG